MRTTTKTTMTIGIAAVAAMSIGMASSAHADYAPSATDAVGVGSDTVQNITGLTADGDTAGDPGYNTAGNKNKLISFDATPDANDRAGYLNGSQSGVDANKKSLLKPLTPTITLRAQTAPVQRPNGSGAGIAALLADTGSVHQIDYVRASRLPKASEQSTAKTNGWGFIHVVEISTDPLDVAAATTTNAPAGLSAAELVSIYSGKVTTWNQLPGNSGGSTSTIIPLIPQAGSGTLSTFTADLTAANGGQAVVLASSVQTVEENDPTSITNATQPGSTVVDSADAIAPFSGGRLKLYNSGYFKDPTKAYSSTNPSPALAPGIALLTGTPGDGNAVYNDVRGLYILFRDSDINGVVGSANPPAAPFQAGSTKNYAQTLFSGTRNYFSTSAAAATIAAAGGTPMYSDLGNVSNG